MLKSSANAEYRDEVAAIVAHNLQTYMKEHRWTGRSLALALGLKPIYVQRRMSGEVEMSATDLKLIGDKIGMTLDDFYKVPPTGIEPATYGTDVRRFTDGREALERDELGTLHDLAARRERNAKRSA